LEDARTEGSKRIKRTGNTQVVERDGHAIAGKKGIAPCIMMVGCVKAVFWTGSAAPSRATEVNERIDLRRTLQGELRDWMALQM
jgi:hypothetical protein